MCAARGSLTAEERPLISLFGAEAVSGSTAKRSLGLDFGTDHDREGVFRQHCSLKVAEGSVASRLSLAQVVVEAAMSQVKPSSRAVGWHVAADCKGPEIREIRAVSEPGDNVTDKVETQPGGSSHSSECT
jgi:hypothetical protein